MLGVIEALLALIGFVALVVACGALLGVWLEERDTEPAPDPYREGLDTAARISAKAWEAEQALYKAASQRPGE